MNTLVRIQFGSHLYGTSTPTSDQDWKAVHLPSAEDILLQRIQDSIASGPKKKEEGQRNSPGDVDTESYALHRYLELLAQGQTVALDMLFAPEPLESSSLWARLQVNSHRLLTKKSAAFVGYCRTQANKYGIKGSRVAAAKAAMEFFKTTMEECGPATKLTDVQVSMIKALVDDADEHTSIEEIETTKFFVCCNRKVAFGTTVKQAAEVFGKIYANYGARAQLAQTNEGIDWKALSHAVRVATEALELLGTGRITFPLPNAAEVLSIKLGSRPYAEVAERIEGLLAEVEAASSVSMLPDKVDQAWIDDFVLEAYGGQVMQAITAEFKVGDRVRVRGQNVLLEAYDRVVGAE